MAILRSKDIIKMNASEIKDKIAELRVELIKAKVKGKSGSKSNVKEIKRTIAKLLTIGKINKTKGEKK